MDQTKQTTQGFTYPIAQRSTPHWEAQATNWQLTQSMTANMGYY